VGAQGPPGETNAWRLGGTAGTRPGDYVGTSDAQPLELRAAGARGLLLQPASAGGTPSLVGGSAANLAASAVAGATIAGGGSSGEPNLAQADYATIGGGSDNVAGGVHATVAGGLGNWASGDQATVVGGDSNAAGGVESTVLGGHSNSAGGANAVALGSENVASAPYALAIGRQAYAEHDGAQIVADDSGSEFHSTAENEYAARFAGGYRWRSSADGSTGCDLRADTGIIDCTSDGRLKRAFHRIDERALLARLLAMPIRTWRYRAERGRVRHLGPTAQAFKAAFGLGTGDTTIGQLDEGGVALAAGQALARRADAEQQQIRRLERRVRTLERSLRR
jgi:hypothetical protein